MIEEVNVTIIPNDSIADVDPTQEQSNESQNVVQSGNLELDHSTIGNIL